MMSEPMPLPRSKCPLPFFGLARAAEQLGVVVEIVAPPAAAAAAAALLHPLGSLPLLALRFRLELAAVRLRDLVIVLLPVGRAVVKAVLVEELSLPVVPALLHHARFRLRPRVHRRGPHERHVHAQRAMDAGAVEADEDAVLDGRPVGVPRGAIRADLVLRQHVQPPDYAREVVLEDAARHLGPPNASLDPR